MDSRNILRFTLILFCLGFCTRSYPFFLMADHRSRSTPGGSPAWSCQAGLGTVRCRPGGGPWSCGEFLAWSISSWPGDAWGMEGFLEGMATTRRLGNSKKHRDPVLIGSYSPCDSNSSSHPLDWMLGCFQTCFQVWRSMSNNKYQTICRCQMDSSPEWKIQMRYYFDRHLGCLGSLPSHRGWQTELLSELLPTPGLGDGRVAGMPQVSHMRGMDGLGPWIATG